MLRMCVCVYERLKPTWQLPKAPVWHSEQVTNRTLRSLLSSCWLLLSTLCLRGVVCVGVLCQPPAVTAVWFRTFTSLNCICDNGYELINLLIFKTNAVSTLILPTCAYCQRRTFDCRRLPVPLTVDNTCLNFVAFAWFLTKYHSIRRLFCGAGSENGFWEGAILDQRGLPKIRFHQLMGIDSVLVVVYSS